MFFTFKLSGRLARLWSTAIGITVVTGTVAVAQCPWGTINVGGMPMSCGANTQICVRAGLGSPARGGPGGIFLDPGSF